MSRIPPPSSRGRGTTSRISTTKSTSGTSGTASPSSRMRTTSTISTTSAPGTPTRTGSSSGSGAGIGSGIGSGNTIPTRTSTRPAGAIGLRAPTSSSTSTSTRLAPPASPTKRTGAASPSKAGSRSPTKSGSRSPLKAPSSPVKSNADIPAPPKPTLSLREQIALKRAEAKKAVTASSRTPIDDSELGPDAVPGGETPVEEEDALGRLPLREVIERARGSGILNLTSRELSCLPLELFDIHLSVQPEPLVLVPTPPTLPPPSSALSRRGGGGGDSVAWYEQQDLEVLKAGDNDIVELHPEIAMFGSLKIIDLHKNKLTFLPPAFADLMALTSLDLSHNLLASLPPTLFALPHLLTLDISHNQLISLPFSSPFQSKGVNGEPFTAFMGAQDRRDPFAPVLSRATRPLPVLHRLNASSNKISAGSIDVDSLPLALKHLDLSSNALGGGSFGGAKLVQALSRLEKLEEVLLAHADISDDAFSSTATAASENRGEAFFPVLSTLDASSTHCTLPALASFLAPTKKELDTESTLVPVKPGTIRVLVGRKIVKESWEVEADRRTNARRAGQEKAAEALVRARAEAEASKLTKTDKMSQSAQREEGSKDDGGFGDWTIPVTKSTTKAPTVPRVVIKEKWELDAEAGLLTIGGQRRARAAAAAAAEAAEAEAAAKSAAKSAALASASTTSVSTPLDPTHLLSHSQYYESSSRTLTLPASQPPSRSAHNQIHGRSFSMASPGGLRSPASNANLALPTITAPLSLICGSPIAATLKVLILSGRRADPGFELPVILPDGDGALMPALEELRLDNCRLSDSNPISRDGTRTSEDILPLLPTFFPKLKTLDLSFNALTSSVLTFSTLSALILGSLPNSDLDSPHFNEGEIARPGLRHLRLRGNSLPVDALSGFIELAGMFKGNRQVPEWRLEELDLRDNEIGKLPPELGLLPLEVLLVEGNTFRIPQSRVWEREGTKGLLAWLRGRIE